jgi:hypothetical protein
MDPHNLDADPDLAFHHPALLKRDENDFIFSLHASIVSLQAAIVIPQASIVSVPGPPWL